jgi:hypothetical protein
MLGCSATNRPGLPPTLTPPHRTRMLRRAPPKAGWRARQAGRGASGGPRQVGREAGRGQVGERGSRRGRIEGKIPARGRMGCWAYSALGGSDSGSLVTAGIILNQKTSSRPRSLRPAKTKYY